MVLMPRHDPPPTVDEIRQEIWATTPCTCTPHIVIRSHRRRRTRITAAHTPTCPAGTLGHRRINLDDQP
jgi:hypothetical protein